MSIMLGVKAKDSAVWLPRFIREVERLEGDIKRICVIYGESRDRTLPMLLHWRNTSKHEVVLIHESYLPPEERHGAYLAKLKEDLQELLRKGDEQYYLNLDCDLVSLPPNLAPQLMSRGKDIVAAMVWTENCMPPMFYDTYVFRLDGCMFHPLRPPGIDKNEPFPVDSVSTCYLSKREVELAGVFKNPHPHIGFCNGLREKGYQVWVDPMTVVYHAELAKMGILHQMLNIPMSRVPYIDNTGTKIPHEVVAAEMFHKDLLNWRLSLVEDNSTSLNYLQSLQWWNTRPLITASMKVLNEAEYLPWCLDSIYGFVDRIDIVEGAVTGNKHSGDEDGHSTDDTLKIIREFPDPDKKIRLITGKWKSKEHAQAKLLELCEGKWMLFMDGDEVMDAASIAQMRLWCAHHQDGSMVYAREARFVNLWHDFYHVAYSMNPLSPWAETATPHPFLIWTDTPGLNFGAFHTIVNDGFGDVINGDSKRYRGKRAVLDGAVVCHFGAVKKPDNMRNKLKYEIDRGLPNDPKGSPEEDMWFTGKMPEDFVIDDYKGPWPDSLSSHPMWHKILVKVTKTKPWYEYVLEERVLMDQTGKVA